MERIARKYQRKGVADGVIVSFFVSFYVKNKIQTMYLHARYMVDKVKSLYFALSFWCIGPSRGGTGLSNQ